MSIKTTFKVAIALGGALLVAACDDTNLPGFMKNSKNGKDSARAAAAPGAVKERDVEAPDVFQITAKGLWDGRPSLGGVWVAHPTAKDPERVIIRNTENGKFVVGALFRRERDIPGPRLQVSSDAAVELGLLAGAPSELSVTALRKEEIPVEPAPEVEPALDAPEEISQTTLDDPIAAAEAALDRTEKTARRGPAKSAPKPTAKPAAAAAIAEKPAAPTPANSLSKPYIQIGIFSLEQNAKNSAQSLRGAGLTASIKPGSSKGKNFWRVLAGPAANTSERAAMLKKIKGLGFADAYYVGR
ncbi:Sporulation related domain-containing protein [Aliiroseovarius halocynthiae]|uniref:SPOR domain-containing protein n=1 Tax=Aliiroseovarius halocynthiae TaxID=985055 RepID=A0A545SUT8_9RHOB|nr:SPOR domain-containing protein [Aliiroseovarius halocynthiae]TQV68718.1 SPOR domain-containing protein [Aliiroseovarius halocynthiae]SMR71139.1 Sporulation related domain-containing protein [Aliiroseovarius halocynthiae]